VVKQRTLFPHFENATALVMLMSDNVARKPFAQL